MIFRFRRRRITAVAVAWLVTTNVRAFAGAAQASAPGLVVEEVGKDSVAQAAGLRVGDVLLRWTRDPAPPANPHGASGTLRSPFDLAHVEVEQAPRGRVSLDGLRGREPLLIPIPAGDWRLVVRPNMPASIQALYAEGAASFAAHQYLQAAASWRKTANRARAEGLPQLAAWLLTRTGSALTAAGELRDATQAFAAARNIARGSESVAAIYDAEGLARKGKNDLAGSLTAYRAALNIRERHFPGSLGAARSYNDLGILAMNRGDLAEAARLFQRVLDIRTRQGPGSLAVAGTLNNLAAVAKAQGDLEKAEQLYVSSLTLTERVAPGSPDVSDTLYNMATITLAHGDLAGAQRAGERALQAFEARGKDSIDVTYALTFLAKVAEYRGDLQAANDLHERVLAIVERTSPDSLDLAKALDRLADIMIERSELARGRDLVLRALAIEERLAPDSLTLADSLDSLGLVARESGDLDAADRYYRRSLAIKQQRAPDSQKVSASLTSLGNLAQTRGDLATAERFFRQSLAIDEKLGSKSDLTVTLNNLGVVASNRGDLAAAEDFHRRALAIKTRDAPDSLSVANSLNNLADIAVQRAELDLASDLLHKALAIREKRAPGSLDVAEAASNLGLVALRREQVKEAKRLFEQALSIHERIAPRAPGVAGELDNLAQVALAEGDLAGAGDLLDRSLEISRRTRPSSVFIAATLHARGEVEARRRAWVAANAQFESALAIRSRLAPGSAAEAESLHALGEVARAMLQPQRSLDYFRRAVEAIETQSAKLGGSDDARAAHGSQYASYYGDYAGALLDADRQADAFQVLERSRARLLLRLLAERDLRFTADEPVQLTAERRRLDTEYEHTEAAVSQLDAAANGPEIDDKIARLRELNADRAALAEKIRQASPKFAALVYPQPLDLAGVRRTLDRGTLMLSYWVLADRTLLFVVQPDQPILSKAPGLTVFTLPLGESALRDQVRGFVALMTRAGLVSDRPLDPPLESARQLFDTLLGPAQELLAASDRVLISPDGPLHELPFGALVSNEGGRSRYVIEWKPLHTVISATVYAELQKTRVATDAGRLGTLVAFGDPFGDPNPARAVDSTGVNPRRKTKRGDALALPASRLEVAALAKLFGERARTFVGAAATEERAKSVPRGTRYVHFATHGRLDDRFPLDSYLAMSIPGRVVDGQDNGMLQAWEIFEQMRIDADLVTLSACDTALGKDRGGEGLVGLTRAFQYAGARSVVASLWSVADESTADLMTRFYGYLKAGQPKDEALRAAQLDLIRSGRFSHPFHWAAFTLNGDWR